MSNMLRSFGTPSRITDKKKTNINKTVRFSFHLHVTVRVCTRERFTLNMSLSKLVSVF